MMGCHWCKLFSVIVFAFIFCPARGAQSVDQLKGGYCEPGAYCTGAPMIVYVVPSSERPGKNNILTFARYFDGKGSIIDFETGKSPVGFDAKSFKAANSIKKGPIQVDGPIFDGNNKSYMSYFCGFYCHNDFAQQLGEIGGDKVQIEYINLPFRHLGEDEDLSLWLPEPDARRNGYTAIRAVTLDGKIKWEKVYLIQTEGTYLDRYGNDGASNVVETASSIGYMLPGDKYFYLENETDGNLSFGRLTIRVYFESGDLAAQDSRIKSVDLHEFQALMREVFLEFDVHYPSKDLWRITRQKNDLHGGFVWSGNGVSDGPKLMDLRIKERWFGSQ